MRRRVKIEVAVAGASGLAVAAAWALEHRRRELPSPLAAADTVGRDGLEQDGLGRNGRPARPGERGRRPAWAGDRNRFLAAIAADPDQAVFSSFPIGRTIAVESFDGTVLRAEAFGPEDATTFVLAHGWTEAMRVWIHQIADLPRHGYRVVAYDLRGHGLSTKSPAGDYSLAAFGDDLEAVLRQTVPPGRRAVVVGHSLGGMTIASWAERHPVTERVSAAALVCTGVVDLLTEHQIFRPPGIPPSVFRPISEFVLGAPGSIPSVSPQLLHAIIKYVAYGPDAGPAQVAFLQQMLLECPPDVRRAAARSMAKMDLYHALPRLTVPSLVIAGSLDKLTPPSHALRMAAALPDPFETVVLPRTGHQAPLERPVELSHWLRKLAARGDGLAAVPPAASRAA
jgi:pimeloyl-ACP methyl ester carboxylesterase